MLFASIVKLESLFKSVSFLFMNRIFCQYLRMSVALITGTCIRGKYSSFRILNQICDEFCNGKYVIILDLIELDC